MLEDNIRKSKNKVGLTRGGLERFDILYYCALGVFLVYMISTHLLLTFDLDFLWKPLFLFCAFILLVRECLNPKMTIKEIIGLVLMMTIAFLVFRIAIGPSANSIIMVFVLAFAARKMEFASIAKFVILVSSIMLFVIVLFSQLGIIENFVMKDQREREFLGFRYALNASALFFNILGLIIYVKKRKISIFLLILLTFINLYFYRKTDSRLSFYLSEALLVFAFIMKKWPQLFEKRKKICLLVALSFLLGAFVAGYLTINYDSSVSWQSKLNSVLTGRLYYGKKSIEKYGFSAFGNSEIEWTGNGLDKEGKTSNQEYLYVDSYYIQVLQRYGIIVLLSILIICTVSMFKILRKKDYYLLFLLGFKAIHCIIDDSSMLLEFNTFWIAMGTVVFRNMFTDGYILSYHGKKKVLHVESH